ncbi:MAG TPA: hypothetical protein VM307_02380 [Egibacteraceae bacterium]|nr:hypothetical protein [Egibacteraceae bacterium]
MTARVNLLPREIEERARTRRTAGWTVAGVAGYAALLLVLYLVKLGDVNAAREERDAEQARVDSLTAELATLEQYAQLDREVTARNNLLSATMATEISWARVLNDLALTFPPSSSMLTFTATTQPAGDAGLTGQPAADPSSDSVADVNFTGYSVERFAPGVERVLVLFDEVETFYNAYLTEASEEERGDTEVTTFNGTFQLNDDAYTGRYEQGLPPEVGR